VFFKGVESVTRSNVQNYSASRSNKMDSKHLYIPAAFVLLVHVIYSTQIELNI